MTEGPPKLAETCVSRPVRGQEIRAQRGRLLSLIAFHCVSLRFVAFRFVVGLWRGAARVGV
jgi:hypothetical protein